MHIVMTLYYKHNVHCNIDKIKYDIDIRYIIDSDLVWKKIDLMTKFWSFVESLPCISSICWKWKGNKELKWLFLCLSFQRTYWKTRMWWIDEDLRLILIMDALLLFVDNSNSINFLTQLCIILLFILKKYFNVIRW